MDADTEMVDAGAISEADSLASTALSEPQSEYDVEEILYERDAEDGPGQEFLVKWTDYELHRAEFVPRENFNTRVVLRNWERKKRDIAAGLAAPFDIEKWQADQDQIAQETAARKEARRAERAERAARRLALLDHPGNDTVTEDLRVNEDTRPQEEANPSSELDRRAGEAQLTRATEQEKSLSVASDTSSSLFVTDEPSSGTRPKRRRLFGGRKDSSLLGPYNPQAPANTSDTPGDTDNHQRQLPQERHEQVNQQPPRSIPQSSNLAAPSSTASVSKRLVPGFGVRPPQTARPRRPKRRERDPDVSQLKLLRPSEYPAREGGADSSLFSTIRSPDQIESSTELRDNPPSSEMAPSSCDPKVRSSDRSNRAQGSPASSSTRAMSHPNGSPTLAAAMEPENPAVTDQGHPQLSSGDRPDTTSVSRPLPMAKASAPQGLNDSSVPREIAPSENSISAEKEVQKAAADTATLSPSYPRAQPEAGKPQEVPHSSLERVPSPYKPASSRSPPRAPTTDRDPSSAGVSAHREKLPTLQSTKRRSPPRELRAVETSRYDRSSDSPVDRESPIQPGGDSWRPSSHRASESRREHDCYRPSPPPPSPDLSRSRVPPRWNLYSPTARSDEMQSRAERPHAQKEPHPTRERPPPSDKSHPEATLDDAEAQIARMPIGIPRPGNCMYTKKGYWWNWGEILVHVYFGPDKKPVGPVRICGMNDEVRGDLLGSKGSGREFEMWFKELCTAEEYTFLCNQAVDNSARCNAWMEGFKDTNSALFQMTEELREQHLIAIYRPVKARGNVWLAWSRKTKSFNFLKWNADRTPAGVPIYLAARPALPPLSLLRSSERGEPGRARRDFPENVHFRDGGSEPRESSEATPGALARRLSIPAIDRAQMAPQLPKQAQSLSGGPTCQSPETISSATKNLGGFASEKPSAGIPSAITVTDPRFRHRPSISTIAPPEDYIHPSRRRLMQSHTHGEVPDSSNAKTQSISGFQNAKSPEKAAGHLNLDTMDLSLDVQAHSIVPQPQRKVPAHIPMSAATGTKMIMQFFQDNIKMTVKKLACLEQGNEDASTDNFYLHFPLDQEETKAEYDLIHTWLKAHDVMVWTDWAKFRNNCKRGVVIFHESFVAYWSMRPAIRDALWASRSISFWNVRISRPLESPDERFCEPGSHFQRLFSGGTAFLITEDVFADLRRTVMILCWFSSFQKNKPGAYKLFLRPDVMEYLNQRLEDPSGDKKEDHLLISMIYWIVKANSVSMRYPHFVPESLNPGQLDNVNNNILSLPVPKYGFRTEADNPEIPKGLTQVERDADHLVEAFSGFTILNAARFRKTIVISSIKNDSLFKRWQSWGHVALYSVGNFFHLYRLDEEFLYNRIKNCANGDMSGEKDGILSATQTPRTPVDPRTPRGPGDGSASENSNPAQAQQRAPLKDKYPAPYK